MNRSWALRPLVLTAGIPSPVRWCSLAFWASKYSLKGFCSAAPSSGTALFPPTGVWGLVVLVEEEEEKEWGEGGVERERQR